MEISGLATWQLPALNAALNSGSAIFLILAYIFIRHRLIWWHRACIIMALLLSALFLLSYLFYHYQVGHVPYGGIGWIRGLYFSILISHVLLAVIILPMIAMTIRLAWLGSQHHPKWGRVTLALWLYVSVTGVLVFWMLQPYAQAHTANMHITHAVPQTTTIPALYLYRLQALIGDA